MANNRIYIRFNPTGELVYLGKNMALEWYDAPFEKLNLFFDHVGITDDFSLVMEDASNSTDCKQEDFKNDRIYVHKVIPPCKHKWFDWGKEFIDVVCTKCGHHNREAELKKEKKHENTF